MEPFDGGVWRELAEARREHSEVLKAREFLGCDVGDFVGFGFGQADAEDLELGVGRQIGDGRVLEGVAAKRELAESGKAPRNGAEVRVAQRWERVEAVVVVNILDAWENSALAGEPDHSVEVEFVPPAVAAFRDLRQAKTLHATKIALTRWLKYAK